MKKSKKKKKTAFNFLSCLMIRSRLWWHWRLKQKLLETVFIRNISTNIFHTVPKINISGFQKKKKTLIFVEIFEKYEWISKVSLLHWSYSEKLIHSTETVTILLSIFTVFSKSNNNWCIITVISIKSWKIKTMFKIAYCCVNQLIIHICQMKTKKYWRDFFSETQKYKQFINISH